jgi:hypothetical protein
LTTPARRARYALEAANLLIMPENEVGTAPPRGRPEVARHDAQRQLFDATGQAVQLPENAVVHSGPKTCPACGSSEVEWGCSDYQQRAKEEIHPLVWHETQWMADSFVCRACDAGWIEPDDPRPITWVRPYWRVS